jgi:hypothetical protein
MSSGCDTGTRANEGVLVQYGTRPERRHHGLLRLMSANGIAMIRGSSKTRTETVQ